MTKTGVTEIDELASEIELANKNLYESTTKLSRIINLVNVPIAAFEFKQNDETVFVTDQLKQVISLEENEAEELSLHNQVY
ncbi:hypothetical protein KHA80_22935 [Anaerobacillus sp. HL2]|nr:hypothetical protein KHA80_22935 [Anaerobacillus sp. HL2]